MENISGFGSSASIIASKTFPIGLYLTEFADDTDPFDIPSIQIADKAMGVNGELIIWSKPNPINVNIVVEGQGCEVQAEPQAAPAPPPSAASPAAVPAAVAAAMPPS